MQAADIRALGWLLPSCLAAALLSAALVPPKVKRKHAALPAPTIAITPDGRVAITGDGEGLRYTLDGSTPTVRSAAYTKAFPAEAPQAIQELAVVPTSVQWRHPTGAQPTCPVVAAAAVDEHGRTGPAAVRTVIPGGSPLALISLVLPEGSFFDPDTGIYVIGNEVFHQEEPAVRRYPRDQKWWKYPGNFHQRGKSSARRAHLEFFPAQAPAAAAPAWSDRVDLRINGNNTRGFAQHALRVSVGGGVPIDLFGAERGHGQRTFLLRSSGNDQDRTFFRDALQHRLCANEPFITSACAPSVVYVNGCYWGLHNMRERIDDHELARRYDVHAEHITILADRLELYKGDDRERAAFARLLTRSERWPVATLADSLERYVDVDGFLRYMAAQIILGNTDWPDQNGKWWRYTGRHRKPGTDTDGRWHFIMGDSDQGMGIVMGPDYDMFTHVERHSDAPLARLLAACERSPALRQRFREAVLALLDGPLSSRNMTAEAQRMRDAIDAEMPRHIARWRRPLTYAAWRAHVDVLLTFARDRGAFVRAQLDRHVPAQTRP